MAEAFLQLSPEDRRVALAFAADASGRPAQLLEKDVWVVWALAAVFEAPFGEHLVFKGGTSLSKAYNVIQRFSEDVDLTYDIRQLVPNLVADAREALPANRAEERRWSAAVRAALPEWVKAHVGPALEARLVGDNLEAEVRVEGDRVFIDYPATGPGTDYVPPRVLLEFGARSTGEPSSPRAVVCDVSAHLSGLAFPVATPRVMAAERTFWEKATAAHVYCAQGRLRGERFSRHWHDLARLDVAGVAAAAIEDRRLAEAVARHKSLFFRETADRAAIDYHAAVGGGLRLKPEGASLEALADDYRRMVESGLLEEEAEPFERLMDACADLADRANAAALRGASAKAG